MFRVDGFRPLVWVVLVLIILVPGSARSMEKYIDKLSPQEQLLEAAECGSTQEIIDALNNGADIDEPNQDGYTPLLLALSAGILSGDLSVAKTLIRYGAIVPDNLFDLVKDPYDRYYLLLVTDFYAVVNKTFDFYAFSTVHLSEDDCDTVVATIMPLLPLGSKEFVDTLYFWLKNNKPELNKFSRFKWFYIKLLQEAPNFDAKRTWLNACFEWFEPAGSQGEFERQVGLYIQSLKLKRDQLDSVIRDKNKWAQKKNMKKLVLPSTGSGIAKPTFFDIAIKFQKQ